MCSWHGVVQTVCVVHRDTKPNVSKVETDGDNRERECMCAVNYTVLLVLTGCGGTDGCRSVSAWLAAVCPRLSCTRCGGEDGQVTFLHLLQEVCPLLDFCLWQWSTGSRRTPLGSHTGCRGQEGLVLLESTILSTILKAEALMLMLACSNSDIMLLINSCNIHHGHHHLSPLVVLVLLCSWWKCCPLRPDPKGDKHSDLI